MKFGFLHALVLVMAMLCTTSMAQTRKLREFPAANVTKAALDRLGNLYLVSGNTIRKFDTEGAFLNEFEAADSSKITLIEPWNPLRVFIYSQPKQDITILDRFLIRIDGLLLDPSIAFSPSLASPLPNNSLWILDSSDNSLKKVDPKGSQVTLEIQLKSASAQKAEYTFLREYQNQLFLIDKKSGIYIYSFVGKAIRQFPVLNLNFMGFLGEEIYYLDKGTIKFYDLYTEEQRELKVDPAAQFVLLTDERMILVKKDIVEVWEYKP